MVKVASRSRLVRLWREVAVIRAFTLMHLPMLTLFMLRVCCTLFQTSHQLDRYWHLFWLKYSELLLSHGAFAQTLSGAGCTHRGHWVALHRAHGCVHLFIYLFWLMAWCIALAPRPRLMEINISFHHCGRCESQCSEVQFCPLHYPMTFTWAILPFQSQPQAKTKVC